MIKATRRSVAAVAAALGLGIGAAVWAASAASAAPGKPAVAIPECTRAQLAVWVSPDRGDGAAGSVYYPLDFTNISNRTCFVEGWPGVSATSLSGAQLGSPAQRVTNVARTVVTLAPRTSAHAILRYVDVQIDPTAGCRERTASFLKVYAPDRVNANNAFFDLPVCSVKGRIYMTITRIAPGA